MGFHALIIAGSIIVLASVFFVFQIFLENKTVQKAPSPSPVSTVESKDTQSSSPAPSAGSAFPSVSPAPLPSPIKQTPNPSPKVITQLQNNTSSETTGSSAISGTIYMNGSAPSGSSIVIVQRPHGSNNASATVVSGISPQTGSSWSWNGAQNGVEYDVVAVLKGSSGGQNIDYAQSPTYNLTAPTNSFLITVNVGYIMSAPTGNITVKCNTHYSNNTWYATVNYPAVSNALMYWLQVGSTSGGTDIANIPKNAQTQDVTLNDSQQYYARYAVSPVSNPTSYQYSAFSSPTQIRCP